MKKNTINPKVGDTVVVRIPKLKCTGTGTLTEFREEDGKIYPIVRVTETDGSGFGPLWESTIKRCGGVNMICTMRNILSIVK